MGAACSPSLFHYLRTKLIIRKSECCKLVYSLVALVLRLIKLTLDPSLWRLTLVCCVQPSSPTASISPCHPCELTLTQKCSLLLEADHPARNFAFKSVCNNRL
jgi:hypothetical protein